MGMGTARIVGRSFIDLSFLDAGQQFQFFSDEICRKFGKLASEKINDRADFPAHFDTLEVGDSRCVLIKTPIHSVDRTKQLVADDDTDDLFVTFMLSGTIKAEQDGDLRLASARDLIVLDHSRPFSFKTCGDDGSHTALVVRLAREDYSDDDALKELFNSERFTQHKFSSLLHRSLAQLSSSIADPHDQEDVTLLGVVETLVDLIAHDNSLRVLENSNEQMFQLIAFEIERQLQDHSLSAMSVGHTFGISKERVEEIMKYHETSFADFVDDKRLSLVLKRLGDPNYRHMAVGDILHNSGFADLPSFYRVFIDKAELAPEDMRRALERIQPKLH